MGEAVIGQAHTLKVRALVKLGELLEALPKATGAAGIGKSKSAVPDRHHTQDAATYADLGVTKKLASVAQQLAALPDATREAIAQREVTLSQARREIKAAEVTRRVSLPDAKYRVLYADPPWSYHDKADAGAVQSGGVERHYPSLSIAETISDMSGLRVTIRPVPLTEEAAHTVYRLLSLRFRQSSLCSLRRILKDPAYFSSS